MCRVTAVWGELGLGGCGQAQDWGPNEAELQKWLWQGRWGGASGAGSPALQAL